MKKWIILFLLCGKRFCEGPVEMLADFGEGLGRCGKETDGLGGENAMAVASLVGKICRGCLRGEKSVAGSSIGSTVTDLTERRSSQNCREKKKGGWESRGNEDGCRHQLGNSGKSEGTA